MLGSIAPQNAAADEELHRPGRRDAVRACVSHGQCQKYLPPVESDQFSPRNYCNIISRDTKCLLYHIYLQRASCFATESGLKVAVEAGKCSQANAFIQTEIFQVKFAIFLSIFPIYHVKILVSNIIIGKNVHLINNKFIVHSTIIFLRAVHIIVKIE